MIQDIAPLVYDNSFAERQPKADDFLIFIGSYSVLCRTENGIALPKYSETDSLGLETTYLFSVGAASFFRASGRIQEAELVSKGFDYENLYSLRTLPPKHLAFACETAYQLSHWYSLNRYCGCCGKAMKSSHKERMLFCEGCKNEVYPRICPAVIVGVVKDGDEILLTKYQGTGEKHYALIAGFAEVGETIEQTVHREVFEETGVRVKNLRYYKSQPWSFSDTLLFGFFCELDGDDTIKVQQSELSAAQWTKREEVPSDDGISLTYEMMELFKSGGWRV